MSDLSPGVRALDLVLAYGPSVALAASTFQLPRGGVSAVIGPNGSGKSTLLNAIAGLKEPLSGNLEVLGLPPRGARRRVSYVLQATKVNERMPITVREVVAMGRYAATGPFGRLSAEDRRAVELAMERLGISHLADRHLRELSAGQRQRVFVAQGLAQDRLLFLLDEPLTGLDLVSTEQILDVVAEERQRGGTVVMTTHDLAEANLADHVLLLAGRVVASGPPEEVLTAERLGEAYGTRVIEVGGQVLLDDAAHTPAGRRHVHMERSVPTEDDRL